MISHDEVSSFRHLIRQFDIAFSQCRLLQIGFIKWFVINVYITRLVYINPFPWQADHTFDQNLIVIIKRNDITTFISPAPYGCNDVPIHQGRRHRSTVNPQDRKEQVGYEYNSSRDNKQNGNCAAQQVSILLFVGVLFSSSSSCSTSGVEETGFVSRRHPACAVLAQSPVSAPLPTAPAWAWRKSVFVS